MTKLDVLNRKPFVERIIKLIENISANKVSTTFSINGIWGSGKSFVLDKLEEELSSIQNEAISTEKYFIIRYNCWKYDYYEEPLIAIVSQMITIIEKKTKTFPDTEASKEVLGMLKATGLALLAVTNEAIKSATKVDVKAYYDAYKTVTDGAKQGAKEYAEKHDYDVFFGLNKVLEQLSSVLQELSTKQTIVFLVDELDRCLPEYAIKVLERLHHLTENTTNIVTVVSIDREQLLSCVKHVFGFDKPEKYLEKFIHFEVKLDKGNVSEKITEKNKEFFSLFDKALFSFDDSIEEYMQKIFQNVDARTQEQIIYRCTIVHKMLIREKKDYVFMCMELLFGVLLFFYNIDRYFFETSFSIDDEKTYFNVPSISAPPFAKFIKEKIDALNMTKIHYTVERKDGYHLPEKENLYSAIILLIYSFHHNRRNTLVFYEKGGIYEAIVKHKSDLDMFFETLELIKP